MVRRRSSAGGDQTGWSENKIIELTALGATGTRPSAPQDERTNPSQIFGATCRKQGKGCGLVPPWRNTEAMILQLAAIAAKVAPGRRAVLLVDQARWHLSARLPVSSKIAILPMPARCTERGPHENVWEFMRDNWPSNRAFTRCDNLVHHCREAWKKLTD